MHTLAVGQARFSCNGRVLWKFFLTCLFELWVKATSAGRKQKKLLAYRPFFSTSDEQSHSNSKIFLLYSETPTYGNFSNTVTSLLRPLFLAA